MMLLTWKVWVWLWSFLIVVVGDFVEIDEGPLGSCLDQKIYAQKDNLSHLLLKS